MEIIQSHWAFTIPNVINAGRTDIVKGNSLICESYCLEQPILSSAKLITKSDEYGYLGPWLGDCMFLTTGQRWKVRRKQLTPAFHFQILNGFMDVFNDQSRELVARMEEHLAAGPVVDVFPLITKATIDIICQSSMGGQAARNGQFDAYCHSVHRITQITMERGVKPWIHSDWIFNRTALGRENQRCVEVLHNFTDQVIRDRRRALEEEERRQEEELDAEPESNKRLTFLDLMLKAQRDGADISDREIREEVDMIIFAVRNSLSHHDLIRSFRLTRNEYPPYKFCVEENSFIH